jgi:hypothetical protein
MAENLARPNGQHSPSPLNPNGLNQHETEQRKKRITPSTQPTDSKKTKEPNLTN